MDGAALCLPVVTAVTAETIPDLGSLTGEPVVESVFGAEPASLPDLSKTNTVSDLMRRKVWTFVSRQAEEDGPFTAAKLLSSRESGVEPDCIRKWREEQKERIRAKDEQEAKKKDELRQKAKAELETW